VPFLIPILLRAIFLAPGVIAGLTIQKTAQAAVADRFGESGPRRFGRLAPSPALQLDRWGTFVALLLAVGWARPLELGMVRLGRQNAIILGLVGPLTSAALAALLGLPLRLAIGAGWASYGYLPSNLGGLDLASVGAAGLLWYFLLWAFIFNCATAVFDCLPLPPLDGYLVARALLHRQLQAAFNWLDRTGEALIIVVALLSALFGVQIVQTVVNFGLLPLSSLLTGTPLSLAP
jgi:Zn-dependent protease